MQLEECLDKIQTIDNLSRQDESKSWFQQLGVSVLPNEIALCTAYDFVYNCLATDKHKPIYIDPEPFGGIMFWFVDKISMYPVVCTNQGQVLRYDYVVDFNTTELYLYNIYPVSNN